MNDKEIVKALGAISKKMDGVSSAISLLSDRLCDQSLRIDEGNRKTAALEKRVSETERVLRGLMDDPDAVLRRQRGTVAMDRDRVYSGLDRERMDRVDSLRALRDAGRLVPSGDGVHLTRSMRRGDSVVRVVMLVEDDNGQV